MPLMCRTPLAASPQELGTSPTTTMRRPLRAIASSTLTYWKVIVFRSSSSQPTAPYRLQRPASSRAGKFLNLILRGRNLRSSDARFVAPRLHQEQNHDSTHFVGRRVVERRVGND